jgi:carbamoyl-phosphate synthase large subunit
MTDKKVLKSKEYSLEIDGEKKKVKCYVPKRPDFFSVKSVVFPFARFKNADTLLGPEMKSTGEVMGIDKKFDVALSKAQIGTGKKLPNGGTALISVKDEDKPKAVELAKQLMDLGFNIMATGGTTKYLDTHGIPVQRVNKVSQGKPHVVDYIYEGKISLVVNTADSTVTFKDGLAIRRNALMRGVTYVTVMNGAFALVKAIRALKENHMTVNAIQEIF